MTKVTKYFWLTVRRRSRLPAVFLLTTELELGVLIPAPLEIGAAIEVFERSRTLDSGKVVSIGSNHPKYFAGFERTVQSAFRIIRKTPTQPEVIKEILPEWFQHGDRLRVQGSAKELRSHLRDNPRMWRR